MSINFKPQVALKGVLAASAFTLGASCHWISPPLSIPADAGEEQQALFEDPATHFVATGELGGGCGIHPDLVESPHFVALNVQNTPEDYASWLPRPNQDHRTKGIWDNGRNCGRWVRVFLSDTCVDGPVSGRKDEAKCERYQADDKNGATADFVVTDSCQDDNRWCRDYPYHLDLSTASLKNFVKDGKNVGDLTPLWSNRKVKWRFIESPQKKPLEIHFIRNAQLMWATIGITHLKNGLHGVLFQDPEGQWLPGKMNGDNGQTYQISPKDAQGNFAIKIIDANDRVDPTAYEFSFPCPKVCSAPYTKVDYRVNGSDPSTAPSLPPEQDSRQSPSPTPPPVDQMPPQLPPAPSPQSPPVQDQSPPFQETPSNPSNAGSLNLVYKQQSQWESGYCVEVEVSHFEQKTTKSWSARMVLKNGKVQNSWNLNLSSGEDGIYSFSPTEPWAQGIAPGQRVGGMGFCVSGTTYGEGAPKTHSFEVSF